MLRICPYTQRHVLVFQFVTGCPATLPGQSSVTLHATPTLPDSSQPRLPVRHHNPIPAYTRILPSVSLSLTRPPSDTQSGSREGDPISEPRLEACLASTVPYRYRRNTARATHGFHFRVLLSEVIEDTIPCSHMTSSSSPPSTGVFCLAYFLCDRLSSSFPCDRSMNRLISSSRLLRGEDPSQTIHKSRSISFAFP